MIEDETRTEGLQEVEKQKHTKLAVGEADGQQSDGMKRRRNGEMLGGRTKVILIQIQIQKGGGGDLKEFLL